MLFMGGNSYFTRLGDDAYIGFERAMSTRDLSSALVAHSGIKNKLGRGQTKCAPASQGGSIRGKVVADIPDQRRSLSGVVVTLSGERLGDRKLQNVSDYEGGYDFAGLVAGEYVV